MRELQAQAANGDKVIISDFQRVERHLEAMSRGPDYVARFIPNSTRMNSSGYLDHVMQELKEALMRARGMINRRKEQVNVILQKASKADMLGRLLMSITSSFVRGIQRELQWKHRVLRVYFTTSSRV